jgi:hypothetical protein
MNDPLKLSKSREYFRTEHGTSWTVDQQLYLILYDVPSYGHYCTTRLQPWTFKCCLTFVAASCDRVSTTPERVIAVAKCLSLITSCEVLQLRRA